MNRELSAAHITDPELAASYRECRRLNAMHGRTYFFATRLLQPRQRPAVHALYGFARYADDIVDEPDPSTGTEGVRAALTELGDALQAGLATGRTDHPLLAAVVDTAARYSIATPLFTDFLHSMHMDLTVTDYPTRADLQRYVYGSAEVIGLQVLPVLETVCDQEEAAPAAAALGEAFQLTNFLRDVAEDLQRDRVYLPADELADFGVDRELLEWCAQYRTVDSRVRRALIEQIAFTRSVYDRARPGIAMLHPRSRPCVATALSLYGGILERIEALNYNVFAGRARVGTPRRLGLAAKAVTGTAFARVATSPARTMRRPA